MTATTTTHRRAPQAALKVTQQRVLRSEWTKFRSLRSSYITLAVAVALTVGLGALISAVRAAHYAQDKLQGRADLDPVVTSLNGVRIAQLAVGVLGVMLISGEYATGMIRATLTAVPKRLPVLWAKLGVFTGVVGIASVVSTFAAFFIGQALLHSKNLGVPLSHPGALRMVIGAGLYLTVVGIIGLAFGALLRNTAGGISAMVALFFVIPPIMNLLPTSWNNDLGPYLPSNAGEALWANPGSPTLAPWNGFAVLCAWAAVVIALAAVRLVSQDA